MIRLCNLFDLLFVHPYMKYTCTEITERKNSGREEEEKKIKHHKISRKGKDEYTVHTKRLVLLFTRIINYIR